MKKLLAIMLAAIVFTGCNEGRQTGDDKSLSDEELLDLDQEKTFMYFWDGAEPNSGMARERYHVDEDFPGEVVTSGGTGFGIMAIIAGIERGFVTCEEGVERLERIVNFLSRADRFHGAWPHWLNGETGRVQPLSERDNGADLVETAFLVQGLLAAKQYLLDGNKHEKSIASLIDLMWREVECRAPSL